jgi:hypothetical protein
MTLGRKRWLARSAGCVLGACVLEMTTPGCSLGEGSGYVTGTLNVPLCWSGPFNLNPTFFGAVPYMNSLDIRIQNGADISTFSDGVFILVDNVHAVRGDAPYSSEIGKELTLSLPPAVVAPGDPIVPNPNPASVHLTLYLNRSCQTEEIALYALDKVSLNADGSCDPTEAGPLTLQCDGDNMGLVDAGSPDAGDSGPTALPTAIRTKPTPRSASRRPRSRPTSVTRAMVARVASVLPRLAAGISRASSVSTSSEGSRRSPSNSRAVAWLGACFGRAETISPL